jgi:hypothetical protein
MSTSSTHHKVFNGLEVTTSISCRQPSTQDDGDLTAKMVVLNLRVAPTKPGRDDDDLAPTELTNTEDALNVPQGLPGVRIAILARIDEV